MKLRLVLPALLVLSGSLPSLANAEPNGALLFSDYRCGACHGKDGHGSIRDPKAKNIAGMNADMVVKTVNRLIAEGGHEDYAGGGCGSAPNDAQIQAIANYVAGLPQ